MTRLTGPRGPVECPGLKGYPAYVSYTTTVDKASQSDTLQVELNPELP
jgi:hypothetical protein